MYLYIPHSQKSHVHNFKLLVLLCSDVPILTLFLPSMNHICFPFLFVLLGILKVINLLLINYLLFSNTSLRILYYMEHRFLMLQYCRDFVIPVLTIIFEGHNHYNCEYPHNFEEDPGSRPYERVLKLSSPWRPGL